MARNAPNPPKACTNGAGRLPAEMGPNEFLCGKKKKRKLQSCQKEFYGAAVAPTTNFWGVWGVVKHARTIPPPVETPFTYVPASQDWHG